MPHTRDARHAPDLSADDLLSIIDHELGNLTTVIVALAATLERRWDELSEGDRRDMARRLASQAAELATLLGNLRQLRAGGAFADAPATRGVDSAPSTTLAAIAEDVRLVAPSHRVAVDVEPGLPAMRLDSGRLAQVLRNLVANAAKFAPVGSVIDIRVRSVGDSLELTVDDAGPGIPPQDRERVFDKFVQLDPGRPGTGLGLFICQAIVAGLGGKITIGESDSGGCRVCIRLPLARA